MAKHVAPRHRANVVYIEQQIDAWIRAQINGRAWVPVEPAQPVFIRRREVLRRCGFSNFKRWKLETAARFPRGYMMGETTNGCLVAANHHAPVAATAHLVRRAPLPASSEAAD